MQKRLTRLLWSVGTVAAVLLSVTAMPANASSPPSLSLPSDEWVQSAESYADVLRNNSAGDEDFALVKVDQKTQKVAIYRKGGAAIPRYTSVPIPAGVEVEFRSALLSDGETRRLLDQIKEEWPGIEARGIVINAITSEWTGPVTIRVERLTAEARELPKTFASYGPIVVEEGPAAQPLRQFDTVARAGANIVSAAQAHRCTSGFAGRSAGNGRGYMIVADHCVHDPDPRFWSSNHLGTSGGTYLGTTTVRDPSHDIAYVQTSGIAYAETWDGPVTGPSFTKYVTAMQKPAVGMSNVCTSGAFTGASCYGSIIGGGWWPYPGAPMAWLYVLESNSYTSMAGHGDSGGPVFRPNGNAVTAIGMISRADLMDDFAVACPAGSFATPPCYSRIGIADVYTEAWLNHDINLTQHYIP